MRQCSRWWMSGWVVFVCLCVDNGAASADEAADLAFFEQKVRPVLIEHCHACHAQDANKVRGGLLLDSRAGWQRGGDSGEPAVVPGKPDESPLILAVRHADGLAMPPDKKLR